MMGDSVNLAARCESGAKFYGIYTMLTDATVRKARQVLTDLRVRRLDRIVVKGKSEPIEVYELWDSSMDCERFDQCRELYESAFDRYLARDWAGAVELFTQALEVEPLRGVSSTTPSAVLLARSRELLEQGVPDRWDGVYRMRTK